MRVYERIEVGDLYQNRYEYFHFTWVLPKDIFSPCLGDTQSHLFYWP